MIMLPCYNSTKCIRCQQNVHSKHTLHILTSNVTAFTAHQQHQKLQHVKGILENAAVNYVNNLQTSNTDGDT